ncbi:MAG: hypothetical protein AAF211_02100 [Myxococcota bacterium]
MIMLWFFACRELPEAPLELGELGRFLFDRFDDDDSAELEAGLTNLVVRLRAEDFTLDAADRAVAMPVLGPEVLGALSLPEGTTSEDQVGVAVSGVSTFPLEEQRRLVVDPVQTCVESAATTWAGRTFDSDPDCFFASCDRLVTGNAVRRESLLARVWYDQPKIYRAFTLEGDDVDVVLGRAHIDRVFESDGGGNAWRQLFQLDAFVRDGDRTLRWFASWTEIEVLGLSDDLLANLVVSGVEEALQFGDEILAGGESRCPHDRDAPMPTRP